MQADLFYHFKICMQSQCTCSTQADLILYIALRIQAINYLAWPFVYLTLLLIMLCCNTGSCEHDENLHDMMLTASCCRT